jgi:hypothetical protein
MSPVVLEPIMNKDELKSILRSEVDRIRRMPHEELLRTIGSAPYAADHVGASGDKYNISVKTKLKSRKKGLIRVKASVNEATPRVVIKKLPILGIPISCVSGCCMAMSIFTVGPSDLN